MPNIPSPISETDEEDPSSASSGSYFPQVTASTTKPNSAATNFSRPRPPGRGDSYTSTAKLHRDPSAAHTISAFYEPNRDLPDEPRFSLDSEQTTSTSENSAGSDFAWDGERGELRARKPQSSRPAKFDQQRVSMDGQRRAAGSRNGSAAERSHQQPPNEMPQSSSGSRQSSRGGPTITKRVSVDQHSTISARPSSDSHYEDSRSHHTVSESGSSGSFDMDGNWQSSDYDYSGLSEKELAKLRKKGINPALYAEMKAAKKGRNKWIGSLSGNTFLS